MKFKYFIILFFLSFYFFATANENLNRVIADCEEKLAVDSLNLDALQRASYAYLNLNDYTNAIRYAQRLRDHTNQKSKYHRAALIALGQAYIIKGEPLLSYKNLRQAELICDSVNVDSVLCSLYNGLGLYELNINDDRYRALNYFFKGLKASSEIGYDRLYSILLNNISETYYLLSDPSGMEYAQAAYEMGHKLNDPMLMFAAAMETSRAFTLQHKYDEAHNYLLEAEFLMENNEIHQHSLVYNMMGELMHILGKDDKAKSYYNKSFQWHDENASQGIRARYGYAQMLIDHGQYNEAQQMIEEALNLTFQTGNNVAYSDLIKILSTIEEKKGNFARALSYYKDFHQRSDSIFIAERDRTMREVRAQFDIERRDNELNLHRITIVRKDMQLNTLFIIVGAVLILAISLWIMYKRKAKLYKAIVKQNKQNLTIESDLRQTIERLQTKLETQTVTTDGEESTNTDKSSSAQSLSEDKISDLIVRLDHLMTTNKAYTDNNLTKDRVSELLGTNRTYLSTAIKEHYKMSFTQYVNSYRIREAIRLLSDPDCDMPLKAMCLEIGFSSMTTFYTQFKDATGMTPTIYRQNS